MNPAAAIIQASRRGNHGAMTVLRDQQYGRQPPEPDATPAAAPDAGSPAPSPVAPAGVAERPPYRWLITYGPNDGWLMVGLEKAPDWDLAGMQMVQQPSVKQLIKLLRQVGTVKDMTGLFPEEVQGAVGTEGVRGAAPGAASPAGGPAEDPEPAPANGSGDAPPGAADAAVRAGGPAARSRGERARAAVHGGGLPRDAVPPTGE